MAARRVIAPSPSSSSRASRPARRSSTRSAAAACAPDETLQVGQTRIVELADDEALLAGFDKDTRYAVRRAEREGVSVEITEDGGDTTAIDALHGLVGETQRRAGFPMPLLERYRVAWRALAGAGRAVILEARRDGMLLASGMVVIEGARSYYLFSGSRREERGEPKHYASYALQWAMMRLARDRGAREHDLWGIAPAGCRSGSPVARGRRCSRRASGAARWPGPGAGTSSSTRPCTASARRPASLRGWLRALRR